MSIKWLNKERQPLTVLSRLGYCGNLQKHRVASKWLMGYLDCPVIAIIKSKANHRCFQISTLGTILSSHIGMLTFKYPN